MKIPASRLRKTFRLLSLPASTKKRIKSALSVNPRVRVWQRGLVRRSLHGKRSEKGRNVVFLHNSYYHFYYLAQALRRRGWDALTVSLEDPNGPHANYYHGEDVNLFSRCL